MKIAVLTFSETGTALGQHLAQSMPSTEVTRCEPGGLARWTSEKFVEADALVFIGSLGIAVRAIAPHVNTKTKDPAVVVIDEKGRFAISVLSGHIGQANTLTKQIANQLGAEAVITTATDSRGLFAVDDWATQQGLVITNPKRIKAVSAALLAGETIRIASDFPISGALPTGVVFDDQNPTVIVSCRTLGEDDSALHLVPRALTAGIGCRKNVPATVIGSVFDEVLSATGYDPAAVAEVCSIDLKAHEPGLVEFCENRGLPFRTFSSDQLSQVAGEFTASTFVAATVGVDNVCERSAVLGSGGQLVTHKMSRDGVTVALALREQQIHFDDPARGTNGKEDPTWVN